MRENTSEEKLGIEREIKFLQPFFPNKKNSEEIKDLAVSIIICAKFSATDYNRTFNTDFSPSAFRKAARIRVLLEYRFVEAW